MKKILAMVLALCLMFCAVAASAEGMVDKIKEKGTLVLGTEATYGPYEFLDDNANPIGCDIWLAQQIADELGVELEVTDMAFDGIIDAVKTGMVDIGMNMKRAGSCRSSRRATRTSTPPPSPWRA